MLSIGEIIDLYSAHGARQYGREAVSQLEHALQCAFLAEQAEAAPELIAACFLHDIGHLAGMRMRPPAPQGIAAATPGNDAGAANMQGARGSVPSTNDFHEHRAQDVLRGLFSAAVLEPIRLHVEAKRYLCQADPGYWDILSAESKRSLDIQGGKYSGKEAACFQEAPHAQAAVQLRRWDDRAKIPFAPTPDLEHYRAVLQSVAL